MKSNQQVSNYGDFNYKEHLSPALEWRWRFKAFEVIRVEVLNEQSVRVTFKIKNRILYGLLLKFYPRGFPISGFDSSRLAFAASIIGAGHALKKSRKDGNVIVRKLEIDYTSPVWFSSEIEVPVDIEISFLKETQKYHLVKSKFSIGAGGGHSGESTLFYCKPSIHLLYE